LENNFTALHEPSVAVVILNWNGRHYLEKFLPFLFQSTYSNMQVVVADNGSTDDTPEILRRYADAGLAHVINEPGTDYSKRGAEWLTRMARMAATDLDADWVIHTDADEFWLPAQGTLIDALDAIAERYGVVVGPRTEFVGRPDGPGSFADRLTVRESRARLQPKVAHRAVPDVVVLDRGLPAADPRRRVDHEPVRDLRRRDPAQRGPRRVHDDRCLAAFHQRPQHVRRGDRRPGGAHRRAGLGAQHVGEPPSICNVPASSVILALNFRASCDVNVGEPSLGAGAIRSEVHS